MAIFDCDPSDLIEFAQKWMSLGDAVTSQVVAVIDDPAMALEMNPTAIRMAIDKLEGYNDELTGYLQDALEVLEQETEYCYDKANR